MCPDCATAAASPQPPAVPASGMCAKHPDAKATYQCVKCGVAMCNMCRVTHNDGTHWCMMCAAQSVRGSMEMGPSAGDPSLQGLSCGGHPGVQAVAKCSACGAGVCATCDFLLPAGEHRCPKCVVNLKLALGKDRKKWITGSYICSGWSTIMTIVLVSGALAGAAESEAAAALLGTLLMALYYAPTFTGLGFALYHYERGGHNPPFVWGAIIWSSILSLIAALLFVGGLMMS